MESFLKADTAFAVMSTKKKKKKTVMKERLNKSGNCFEISFLRRNNTLKGMVFGPEVLLECRYDMMLAIYSLSVGCRSIILLLPKSDKWLCDCFMLCL